MDIDCKSLMNGVKISVNREELELLHKAFARLASSTKDVSESETITFENKMLVITRNKK